MVWTLALANASVRRELLNRMPSLLAEELRAESAAGNDDSFLMTDGWDDTSSLCGF